MLLKYLFRTNNTEEVEKRFKNAYVFEKPSGAKEEIRRIFDEENNFTIILHHIDNNADYLLKLLEDSTKTYTFVADYEVGVSEAFRQSSRRYSAPVCGSLAERRSYRADWRVCADMPRYRGFRRVRKSSSPNGPPSGTVPTTSWTTSTSTTTTPFLK